MENPLDSPQTPPAASQLSEEGKAAIRGSIGWMRFAGILFLVAGGILLLTGGGILIFSANIGGNYFSPYQRPQILFANMSVLFYVVMAVFSGALGFLLIKVSESFKRFLDNSVGSQLDSALGRLNLFWKSAGILFIVSAVLCLTLLLVFLTAVITY
jgi:hypothetical protein